jgi:hypothetical protein
MVNLFFHHYYGMAAEYLLFQNSNLYDALFLADQIVEKGGKEGWTRNVKFGVYEKMYLYKKALKEIEKGLINMEKQSYEKDNERIWRNQQKARIIKKMNL